MAEYTIDQEYLDGLNNLRNILTDTEVDNDKLKREFYQCDETNEDLYEKYLKQCNETFLRANTTLKKANVALQVIDSELTLVGLINNVREQGTTVHPEDFQFLAEFWDQIKNTIDSVKVVLSNIESKVFKRILTTCKVLPHISLTLDITDTYNDDVSSYYEKVSQIITDTRLLTLGYANGIDQHLFTNTLFSERILVACDVKAFPLLRLVPDVTEKLTQACRLLRLWMDKDETYLYDISKHIRETRAVKRKKVRVLINKRQERLNLVENVDQAQEIFVTNREKLKKIEAELKTVEAQVDQCTELKKHKAEEKRQKEGIVGFLEISISQTNKNVSLQLKRSRVMRQLRVLEQHLSEVEQELCELQDEMSSKEKEKTEVAEILEETTNSFKTLQTDLDKFTETVEKLQNELEALTNKMGELEYIQNFKTSPELVEDFFDRPVSVKLAPSLKLKIQRRIKNKKDRLKRR